MVQLVDKKNNKSPWRDHNQRTAHSGQDNKKGECMVFHRENMQVSGNCSYIHAVILHVIGSINFY